MSVPSSPVCFIRFKNYCTRKMRWIARLRHVLEPLDKRQIEALRKASGMNTFDMFLDMNDFVLDLATKRGRKKWKSWLGSSVARNGKYRNALLRLVKALDETGIRYALTGAAAVGYYGIPRTSMDIDVVISGNLQSEN